MLKSSFYFFLLCLIISVTNIEPRFFKVPHNPVHNVVKKALQGLFIAALPTTVGSLLYLNHNHGEKMMTPGTHHYKLDQAIKENKWQEVQNLGQETMTKCLHSNPPSYIGSMSTPECRQAVYLQQVIERQESEQARQDATNAWKKGTNKAFEQRKKDLEK